jgi:DNA-binding MarR family transcriptional regulator
VAYLSTVQSASFQELRDKVGATDGNLSTHLRKLEEAGYVGIDKSFVNRKPHTRIALTAAGRKAWLQWLERMRALTGAAES